MGLNDLYSLLNFTPTLPFTPCSPLHPKCLLLNSLLLSKKGHFPCFWSIHTKSLPLGLLIFLHIKSCPWILLTGMSPANNLEGKYSFPHNAGHNFYSLKILLILRFIHLRSGRRDLARRCICNSTSMPCFSWKLEMTHHQHPACQSPAPVGTGSRQNLTVLTHCSQIHTSLQYLQSRKAIKK